MNVRRLAAGSAVALTALLGSAGPAAATASAPTTQADIIGVVKIDRNDPRVGYVQARYRCTGTGSLWVSVKQTADRTADPVLAEEGSSGKAAAMSHSHRNPVECNGKWQVGTFTVDQREWGFGDLAKGEGYVQFCLFDDTTIPPGADSHGEPMSRNEFVHVR